MVTSTWGATWWLVVWITILFLLPNITIITSAGTTKTSDKDKKQSSSSASAQKSSPLETLQLQNRNATAQKRLLRWNDSAFTKYVENVRVRNYSFVFVFTTADSQCPPCRALKNMISGVRDFYLAGLSDPRQEKIFFAYAESKHCPKLFERLKIQHVPAVIFLPEDLHGSGQVTIAQFQLQSIESVTEPDMFVQWLASVSGHRIELPKAWWLDERVWWGLGSLLILLVLWKLPLLYRTLFHPHFWLFVSLAVYMATMQGVVYNAIHKVPFYQENPFTNEITFYAGDMRTQLGAEGVIAAVTHLFCGILWVSLTVSVPKIRWRWIRLVVFLFLFSTLAYIINLIWRSYAAYKFPPYPFHF